MTVQQLIERLMNIENKSLEVSVVDSEWGITEIVGVKLSTGKNDFKWVEIETE